MDFVDSARAKHTRHAWDGVIPHWDAVLEQLPTAVHLYDAEGVRVRANTRARELHVEPFRDSDFDAAICGSAVAGAIGDRDPPPVVEALRAGQKVHDREVVVRARDGSHLFLLCNVDLVRDADDVVIGAVACFQSVAAFRQARRDLRLQRAWTRRTFENSPVAVYWTDERGDIRAFNPAAEILWGGRPEAGAERWCGFHRVFHADGRTMQRGELPLDIAIREGRPVTGGEIGYERRDGRRGAILAYPTPLYDESGKLAGTINMLVDITERRRAAELQKVLLDELNHRVKNTLATIQSLAGQSFRGEREPSEMAAAFESRILALSAAHDQLAARAWSGVDLDVLAQAILAPAGDMQISIEGGAAPMPPGVAVTIAMALHELLSNAKRFGALSTEAGRLSVVWKIDVYGALELEWSESGGPEVAPPHRSGFGRRYLETALANELGGSCELVFTPAGLHCAIRVPGVG